MYARVTRRPSGKVCMTLEKARMCMPVLSPGSFKRFTVPQTHTTMFISTGVLGYAHRSRRRGNEHKYRNDEEDDDDNEKNFVVGSIGMHDDPPLFGAKRPAKGCYFS